MKQITISIVRGGLWLLFYGRSMKIFTFFLLVLAFSANRASAQAPRSADELVVGQRIPDDLWDVPFSSLRVKAGRSDIGDSGVVKGKAFEPAVFRLRELKGRLIILDFWATWCGGCIAGFPKAKKLEERFGGKVSFVLVNNEVPEKAEALLARRLREYGEVFHYVNSDTLLNRLFYKRLIPHYVWIDGGGKVVAVTTPDEVTEGNISRVLADGGDGIRNVLDVDRALPLFSSASLPVKDLLKYSLLTRGKVYGLPSGFHSRKEGAGDRSSGRVITNMSFHYIFNKLFLEHRLKTGAQYGQERLVYEGRNLRLLRDTFFNYEFSVSGHLISSLDSLILADLNTFSPFRFGLERRKVKCLAMRVVDSLKLPRVKAGNVRKMAFVRGNGGKPGTLVVENMEVNRLIYRIKQEGELTGPVTDLTHSDALVSLSLKLPCSLTELNRQLGKYGLKVSELEEELEFGIIRDQPGH